MCRVSAISQTMKGQGDRQVPVSGWGNYAVDESCMHNGTSKRARPMFACPGPCEGRPGHTPTGHLGDKVRTLERVPYASVYVYPVWRRRKDLKIYKRAGQQVMKQGLLASVLLLCGSCMQAAPNYSFQAMPWVMVISHTHLCLCAGCLKQSHHPSQPASSFSGRLEPMATTPRNRWHGSGEGDSMRNARHVSEVVNK